MNCTVITIDEFEAICQETVRDGGEWIEGHDKALESLMPFRSNLNEVIESVGTDPSMPAIGEDIVIAVEDIVDAIRLSLAYEDRVVALAIYGEPYGVSRTLEEGGVLENLTRLYLMHDPYRWGGFFQIGRLYVPTRLKMLRLEGISFRSLGADEGDLEYLRIGVFPPGVDRPIMVSLMMACTKLVYLIIPQYVYHYFTRTHSYRLVRDADEFEREAVSAQISRMRNDLMPRLRWLDIGNLRGVGSRPFVLENGWLYNPSWFNTLEYLRVGSIGQSEIKRISRSLTKCRTLEVTNNRSVKFMHVLSLSHFYEGGSRITQGPPIQVGPSRSNSDEVGSTSEVVGGGRVSITVNATKSGMEVDYTYFRLDPVTFMSHVTDLTLNGPDKEGIYTRLGNIGKIPSLRTLTVSNSRDLGYLSRKLRDTEVQLIVYNARVSDVMDDLASTDQLEFQPIYHFGPAEISDLPYLQSENLNNHEDLYHQIHQAIISSTSDFDID